MKFTTLNNIAGSKELLLEQRVPASYLALEDVVGHIAAARRQAGSDPVLNAEQYRALVWQEMLYRYQRAFRDTAELHQATLFLHDNGTDCKVRVEAGGSSLGRFERHKSPVATL